MRVFSYIIDHDVGFAPNPFYGVCTLAACKPTIRRTAEVGDILVGTGARALSGKLIYWAKIEAVICYDEYWHKAEYFEKKAVMNGSFMQCYGDNIYHTEVSGNIVQEDSFHSRVDGVLSEENFERDVGKTDRVLICQEFLYLGKLAIEIPHKFKDIVHTTQGHKCNFEENLKTDFVSWLQSPGDRGWMGDPIDWP